MKFAGRRQRSASQYDAARPGYPEAMILPFLDPGRRDTALDIGCGTGKMAATLVRLGYRVVGVEPDKNRAAVARAAGHDIEVAPLEEWTRRGRVFSLVTCAQAWHWLAPERRCDIVRDCLPEGGQIVLAWNVVKPPLSLAEALDEAHARFLEHRPLVGRDDAERARGATADVGTYVEELHVNGFCNVVSGSTAWSIRYTVPEWIRLWSTDSWVQSLPHRQRRALTHLVSRNVERLCGADFEVSCVLHIAAGRKA